MTKRRLLIFDAFPDSAGETCRYIGTLFRHGGANGWHPTLLSTAEGPLTAAVSDAGGDIAIVPAAAVRTAGPVATLRYNLKVLSTLREIRPEIVQCHNIGSILLVGLAARLLRIPAVLHLRVTPSTAFGDRLALKLARRVYFPAAALMPARRRAKYRVLPLGVDLAEIDRLIAQRPPGEDPEDNREHLTFAFAGGLLPVNGAHVLIDAFERTRHHISDVRLSVVGDADDAAYAQELRNVVAWQKIEDRVSFHPAGNDAAAILESADIYVEPSLAGAVPASFVEAMVLGKPVIATTGSDAVDLLGDGERGLLVPPDDSAALADAMYRLAAEKPLRRTYGAKAAEYARHRHSIAAHLEQLAAALDEAAADGARIDTAERARALA